MADLQLVIFDCDGTLVDSETISGKILARSLTALGLPTTGAEARAEYQGLLLGEIDALAATKLGRALPEGWLEQFERDRAEAFRGELQAIEGAARAVTAIRESGVTVCVASQGKLEKTRLTLSLTGLRELFEERALFSAWSVPRGKPHPDLFLHAAGAMGVEPACCAVVEDSPSGVQAARAAGMPVFAYSGDGDGSTLNEAGAVVFSSFEQLPALLGVEA